jgi:hypothetical protein
MGKKKLPHGNCSYVVKRKQIQLNHWASLSKEVSHFCIVCFRMHVFNEQVGWSDTFLQNVSRTWVCKNNTSTYGTTLINNHTSCLQPRIYPWFILVHCREHFLFFFFTKIHCLPYTYTILKVPPNSGCHTVTSSSQHHKTLRQLCWKFENMSIYHHPWRGLLLRHLVQIA